MNEGVLNLAIMIHDAALPGTAGGRVPDVEAGEEQLRLRVALLLGQHAGVRALLSPVARQDTVVGIFVVDQRTKQRVGEIHAAGLRGDESTHAGHGKERRDGLFSDDPSPKQSTGAPQLREQTKGIVVVKHRVADDRAATRSHDRRLEPQVNPSGLRATGTNHQTWRQCRRTFEVLEPAEFRNVNGSARAKRRAIHYRQAATCAGGRQAMCLSQRVEMGYVGQ
jgi:hypothetical protein